MEPDLKKALVTMIFKNIFVEKIAKNLAFFKTQKQCKFMKKLDHIIKTPKIAIIALTLWLAENSL
jgi:hypothetical protein